MKRTFTILVLLGIVIWFPAAAQDSLRVSGTIYDTSKHYVIPYVKVFTTSGNETITDSSGRYQLSVGPADSIYFNYNDKNSIKYTVASIDDYSAFDIAIPVKVASKYKVLQPVTVFTDTYREDSLANRIDYGNSFDQPDMDFSITSLAGLLQFRKNKQRKMLRDRLVAQEEDAYIDYKFSPKLITRITGLKGEELKRYRQIYRPPYEFVAYSTEVQFYQYIIDSAKEFRRSISLQ